MPFAPSCAPALSLKRTAAGSAIPAVAQRATDEVGSDGRASTAQQAHPRPGTPASSKPAAALAKDRRQTQLDASSLAILRLVCLAAGQLLSQAGTILM